MAASWSSSSSASSGAMPAGAAAAAPLAEQFHVQRLGREGQHAAGKHPLAVRFDADVPTEKGLRSKIVEIPVFPKLPVCYVRALEATITQKSQQSTFYVLIRNLESPFTYVSITTNKAVEKIHFLKIVI
jgi:hypothetical protein